MAFDLKKYAPFLLSALLMGVMLYVIYPNYQYYIDPDGTAYLTISQRYARGDYHTAINGYWSPWACWLTAGLIKAGIAAIPASVIINALGAIGFMYISQSFFLRFGLEWRLQWLLNLTLAFFLCYAVFWQSFDDLWECFFLLSTLRLMLADGFTGRPLLWLLTGCIGALAYFAKAYSFPFFILNTICCVYFIAKGNKGLWLRISFTAIAAMIICSLPWIYALHNKYGIWTTSTAGTLNTSWYLVGHPYWKEGIHQLIPPAYKDSPYYWEDPWLANGVTPHFWDSWQLVGRQVLRIGLNGYKLLISTLQLSVFFPVIALAALFSLWTKKAGSIFTGRTHILAISFLLFPLGYVLINFESRYLWYMVPLSMVMGGLWIQKRYTSYSRAKQLFAMGLFAVSYIIIPFTVLKDQHNISYDNQYLSYSIPSQASFTSNALPGPKTRQIVCAAYLNGSQYYTIPVPGISNKDLVTEMNRYHVRYYIYFCKDANDHFELTDEHGRTYPWRYADKEGWTLEFEVNPK